MTQNTSSAVMAQRIEPADSSVRTCRVCLQMKPLSLEYFGTTGKPNGKLWFCRKCRQCVADSTRARWRAGPNAAAKDRARRDKKRDQIRAYDRMRCRRDREKKKEIIKRWIENNPERNRELARAKAHRYRARKLVAPGNHTADDIKKLLVGQKGRCWWCNKKVGKKYRVDHRIALARGGSNGPENLVISCTSCNHRKNIMMPAEFVGRLL